MSDDAVVAAADRAARVWAAAAPGPIVPGSEAHKAAFCHMLLDTHNPYKPSIIDWPQLDPEARSRLVGLPIWDIAVQTEGKARLRVLSYAQTITDPLLQRAIDLDGFEEGRHKEVLSNLVRAYGIRLAPEPEYHQPRDPEWAFMVTGFSECIDSVFAFGLFALAKSSGFFPPALVDTFEPIMQEEGRHILFFVNWVCGTGITCRSGGARSFGPRSLRSGLFLFGSGSASRGGSMVPATGRGEWCRRTTTLL